MSDISLSGTNSLHPTPIYRLGGEVVICRIGLGAMRLTGQPGNWGPYADWSHGVRVLREAVELGVNFIDTADAYGPGDSEKLSSSVMRFIPMRKRSSSRQKGEPSKRALALSMPTARQNT